jgi:hypothetical protein
MNESLNDAIEGLRKDSGDSFIKLMELIHPSVCNLFSHFCPEEQITNWFREYCSTIIKSLGKFPQHAEFHFLFLKGALNFSKKKEPDSVNSLLKKCHETLYEDIPVQPFSDNFFDPDSIPSRDSLLSFRKNSLNQPRRLLLELLLLEQLSPQQIAELLNISQDMLEPFFLTLFQQLMDHPEIDMENGDDEMELFSQCLKGIPVRENASQTTINYSLRVKKVCQFLQQDIRIKLPQEELILIHNQYFTPIELPKDKPEEESLIEKIRAQNVARKLEEMNSGGEGGSYSDYPTAIQAPREANEKVLKLFKPALGIIGVFIIMVFYKTFQPLKDGDETISSSGTMVKSLESARVELSTGTLQCEGEPVTLAPGEKIRTLDTECNGTFGDNQVIFQNRTVAFADSPSQLRLITGCLKIHSGKNEFHILSTDGEASGEGAIFWFSKPSVDFSLVGVETGKVAARDKFTSYQIPPSRQVKLGQEKSSMQNFHSAAFFAYNNKRQDSFQLKSSAGDSHPLDEAMLEKYDNDVRRKMEMLKNQSRKSNTFLQKL